MWALFTAALTRNSSSTRVSIVNTSTNFMLTALLGLAMFGEKLPPLWWVGAAGLVVGNVVIGRREEDGVGKGKRERGEGEGRRGGGGGGEYSDGEGEGEVVEMDGKVVGGVDTAEEQEEEEDVDGSRRRAGGL